MTALIRNIDTIREHTGAHIMLTTCTPGYGGTVRCNSW
jgi:hypothetical protein